MLVKRSAFELVDGFREDFGKIGNRSLPEDTDLCLRIASSCRIRPSGCGTRPR